MAHRIRIGEYDSNADNNTSVWVDYATLCDWLKQLAVVADTVDLATLRTRLSQIDATVFGAATKERARTVLESVMTGVFTETEIPIAAQEKLRALYKRLL